MGRMGPPSSSEHQTNEARCGRVGVMVKPAKEGGWGAWTGITVVTIAGLLALPGCSSKGTPSLEPKPITLARAQKVTVIRLGNPAREEPPDTDIADGIRYAGL